MFDVICLVILYNALPEAVFYWGVCCAYFLFRSDYATAPTLYLNFIDMFVCNITVSALACFCMLYNLIIGFTSYC